MADNEICQSCGMDCDLPCTALTKLIYLYRDLRTEEKTLLIRNLRKELNIYDCEVADDLRELGEALINKLPELSYIKDYDIKVGYVRSYEAKKDKGKIKFADCRKVTNSYLAYLPYDFIITFYDPNVYYMSENQLKILMLHELKHIGMGPKGLRVDPHDIEDFKSILYRFGIEWNEFNQDVPDILAGGDSGKEKGKKK